ncbi:MAG TPA: M1 family aminopeptidase, partial [Thermoanaerobaculia bacterium]|nr:M1 family aminopeptidase [Thermoanaerobaculia bacterium]
FSVAFQLIMVVTTLYGLFLSIAAGMSPLADDEQQITELLGATPLSPAEYVWGKFLAVLTAFLTLLFCHLAILAAFSYLVPNPAAVEVRGPFSAWSYLRPALTFVLPTLLFFGGLAFYLGARFLRPLLVFLLPVTVLLVCGSFLWEWAPTWLDPRLNRLLMFFDPSGFRWLNETWLKLDRGVDFYNRSRIPFDALFWWNRLAVSLAGLGAVGLAQRHLERRGRGPATAPARQRQGEAERYDLQSTVSAGLAGLAGSEVSAVLTGRAEPARPAERRELGVRTAGSGWLRGTAAVARAEVRALFSQAGLPLFLVLILAQVLGDNLLAQGAFGTELLLTPGLLAVRTMNTLTFLLCLLLLFYTVESLERERTTRLAPIFYSSPLGTGSLLLGKALANSLVAALLLGATFVGGLTALLIQGKIRLGIGGLSPFLLVWGFLLLPTFLLWTTFVTAVRAVTGSRYATYGIGLAAFTLTLFYQLTGHLNWVSNWLLWDVLHWSDLGVFELDGKALLGNRLLALGLAGLFAAVAVRTFARRQADALNLAGRLGSLPSTALTLVPWAILPLVAATWLGLAVFHGYEGSVMEKKGRDYWKKNLATWKDAPNPALAAVDLDLELDPARHWLRDRGSYDLVNDKAAPLAQFALTGGFDWRQVHWTLDGRSYQPDDRAGLYVFTPPRPLPPGGHARVGFTLEAVVPDGISRNGAGREEFVLPSGVVLTSFRPTFAPIVGYMEEIGRKRGENDYEPKVYPDDAYLGPTDAGIGGNTPSTTRIRISGPAAYTWNSVGTRIADTVRGGRRTTVWQSDHPVRFWNVIGGRWAVSRGASTSIYYHPGHPYNIPEMQRALDAARRYYSEWFYPYPWRELKLSEFPFLAGYAQGFPTNISFSEGIGFLTKSDLKTNAAFLVTAHESAHQWWGNLLTPGKLPGGDLLSEGMSHFSTLLLLQQVLGDGARIEVAKRLEERYGDRRLADAERPLVKIDGMREGDETVTYDKGGWVFWMLADQMGHERAFAGLHQFIRQYKDGPDYPVLQDFVAMMRPFAPDPAAYDAFVHQWFFQVVVPEYRLEQTGKRRLPDGTWEATATVKNAGTGRMPVEVAAVAGERFDDEGKPLSSYREARRTVVLGAGESAALAVHCPFEPQRLVVDPDARVLQLARKSALARL